MLKNIILSACALLFSYANATEFNIGIFKTWDSISQPRALARAISLQKVDNESVRPIAQKAIQNLHSPTPSNFAILWTAREAFKCIDFSICNVCDNQIEKLQNADRSNYFIGFMLLRSQTETDDCESLISNFDIETVLAGISFLQNETNGRKNDAIKILTNISPSMKKIGRDVRIQQ